MTGDTPFEAFESFARPARAALRFITQVPLGPMFRPVPGIDQTLTFRGSADSVPLRRRNLPPLYLEFLSHYRLHDAVDATDQHERLQIQVVDYFHTISDHRNAELISFHWHPEAPNSPRPEPHLHVKIRTAHPTDPSLDELFPNLHIPTGQVTVDAIVRLLIEQFGVTPVNPEWDALLGS